MMNSMCFQYFQLIAIYVHDIYLYIIMNILPCLSLHPCFNFKQSKIRWRCPVYNLFPNCVIICNIDFMASIWIIHFVLFNYNSLVSHPDFVLKEFHFLFLFSWIFSPLQQPFNLRPFWFIKAEDNVCADIIQQNTVWTSAEWQLDKYTTRVHASIQAGTDAILNR